MVAYYNKFGESNPNNIQPGIYLGTLITKNCETSQLTEVQLYLCPLGDLLPSFTLELHLGQIIFTTRMVLFSQF